MSREHLQAFCSGFAALNAGNLEQLGQLYHSDMEFRDPLHQLYGLQAMRDYCANLYQNVSSLNFRFHQQDMLDEQRGVLRWTMRFSHPRLAGGQPVEVEGCSFIWLRDGKVYRHIDYYDAGALLYEHIPLLGRIIGWLKRRLA